MTNKTDKKIEKGLGSKRLRAIKAELDLEKLYPIEEAIAIVKKAANAGFDETVEIALKLGVDPRHSDQNIRGVVSLPNGTGKTVRVAVFARDDKAEEAKKAGADIVGAEDLVEEIQKGNINFDRAIATPDLMPLVGQVAKILGPKGLMPNPKLGSVTPDVAKAVETAKAGEIEYRAEKSGIVHVGIGKVSFDEKALNENLQVFMAAINKAKPSSVKGIYLRKAAVSSTMGPGIKVDVSTLVA